MNYTSYLEPSKALSARTGAKISLRDGRPSGAVVGVPLGQADRAVERLGDDDADEAVGQRQRGQGPALGGALETLVPVITGISSLCIVLSRSCQVQQPAPATGSRKSGGVEGVDVSIRLISER